MRYVYDTLEAALRMSDTLEEFFKEEGLYIDHDILPLPGDRYMVNVTIKE